MLHMVFEHHQRIIHLVQHVVDQPVRRCSSALKRRCTGSECPHQPCRDADALRRSAAAQHQVDGFVRLCAQKLPAALDMARRRMALLLGHDPNAPDTSVDAVSSSASRRYEVASEADPPASHACRCDCFRAIPSRPTSAKAACDAPVDAVPGPAVDLARSMVVFYSGGCQAATVAGPSDPAWPSGTPAGNGRALATADHPGRRAAIDQPAADAIASPMRIGPPGAQAGLKRSAPCGNSSTTVEPSRKRPISSPCARRTACARRSAIRARGPGAAG